jgi:hypothetical protein
MRVAFLDRFGRFCKDPRDLFEVRKFPGDDPDVYTSLTLEQYRKLSRADQMALQQADSAAGLIDTSDKSNA